MFESFCLWFLVCSPISLTSGADFTNTYRSLSQISCPIQEEGEEDECEANKQATELLLQQCASLEELKGANRPTMDQRYKKIVTLKKKWLTA